MNKDQMTALLIGVFNIVVFACGTFLLGIGKLTNVYCKTSIQTGGCL